MKNLNFLSNRICANTPPCGFKGASRIVLVLVLMLTLGVGQMWGAEVTIDISTFGWNTTQGSQSASQDGITIASTSGAKNSTTQLRFYSGGTHTFTSTVGNITKVEFTCTASGTSNYGPGKMSLGSGSAGSYSYSGTKGTWTGDATSFTLSGGQARCTSIVITYTEAVSKTLSSITITTPPTTTKYLNGETFSKSGAVVTANYDDSSTADVSSSATWNKTTLGTSDTKVTASYTEGGETKTADQSINVYSVTVQKQDETGATIIADGVSASASGRTLSASATAASKYVFKGWKYGTAAGTSIASSGNASTTLNGTPTGNVTVIAEFYKPIPVTWNKNGSLHATTYTGYNQKPVFPDEPSSCDATSDTWYGWATGTWDDPVDDLAGKTVYTSADDMPEVTAAGVVYNAVFAKATDSSTPADFTSTFNSKSWGDSGSLWNSGKDGNQLTSGRGVQITTGVTGANATTKSSYSNVSSVVVTYSTNASSGAGTISITVGGTTTTASGSVSTSGGTTDRTITYTPTSPATSLTGNVKITATCTTNSIYIKSVQVNYSTGGTTYSKYLTTCCDPLGSINGSVSLTNDGCGAGELKATWKTNSEGLAGIASQVLHIYKASDDTEVTGKKVTGLTASTENQTQTISGLDNCTAYYVKVENISNGGDYCGDGWAGDASSNATTKGYTYGITKTNVTLKAGANEEGSTCDGDFSAHYEAAAGYALPGSLTVTGASAHTWSISEGVGTLTIDADDVTGNVTTTIAGTCVPPTFTVHPQSKLDYLTTDAAIALGYTASAAGASLTQQWQISSNNVDWNDIDGATSATYTPNIATEGTKYYRVVVTNAACDESRTSDAATITSTAPSGYCISVFNSNNDGIQSGFSNGGDGNEYRLAFTVPGKDGSDNWPQYWIGENNAWASFSANANFADMKYTSSNATLGLAEGATGTLHIWDDNKEAGSNLWIKFEPSGYGFRWGDHENPDWSAAACTKEFTVDAGNANTYWTEMVTLDGTNNTAWDYYVGLQSASGYVYSGVDNEASDARGISRTRSVTAMKVSNGTAGQYKATYLNSEPAGTQGKFRIWNNNIEDYNFVCHFVPFFQLKYDANGGSGSMAAIPATPVSCEESAANRTVTVEANAFTAPTGKQFVKWNTAADGSGADVNAGEYVLTSDVTLYAIWADIDYTVTVSQSPDVSAETTGQTDAAHYNGTINLTTTVPSGYRFVNWTSSDVEISNATSATTASFTMPAKDVAVTANFQQTHTITWKVGTGTASGGSTVVDHGAAMSTLTLPSDPADDALASCGTNKFMGWSANQLKGTGQSAPADLFTEASGETVINEDKTFYAVFANGSGSGSADDYILVEEELSDWSGTYVLVDYGGSNYAMSSDLTSSKFGAVSVSPSDKVINCTNDKLIWTLEKGTGDNASKYSVKSKKTETYANSGSSSTSASLSNSAVYLTIDYTASYGIRIKGASGRWFSYYSSGSDFRTYSGASNDGFSLYKKNEVTYADYQTSCCVTLGAVSNVNVVPDRTSATVSWDKLTNASGYEYKLGDADWATASVADAEHPSISLSTLSGATSYAIQIRATGDGETYCAEGTASAVTNFKTLSRVTAAVNDGARGTAKVSLTSGSGWADYVDAADGTTIYLQATPSSESWILGNWSASNGTVASNQLTGWTDDVTVTANFAAAELPTLGTPTNMASTPTAISATLTWDAVANASGYAVTCEKTSDHSTTGIVIGDVTGTTTKSCTVTGLSAGTGYTWTVQAVGDNINYQSGAACADQSFTTVAKQPKAVAVTTAPSKTSYLEGESFDATGMVVRVTYNTEEVDDDADNYTVTPAGALEYGTTSVTITVNGSAISTTQAITVVKKYTLTLKNNGVQVGEVRDLYEGAEYGALPELTAGDACDATSTTFMGWTTASILEKQAAAPASYASATDVMGAADVVLNAVWAKTKTLATEPISITSFATGDYYLIDKQGDYYYAMSGTGSSSISGVNVTDYISYNSTTQQITITDESEMTAAMKYTISGTTSAAKIYNASTKAWVTTQSSGTSFSTSEGSNVVTNHDSEPRFAFSYTTLGSSGNRCILYRSSQSGFLNYATVNMGASGYASGYLWLVPVGIPATYEDYLTSCCFNWSASAPEISYSAPDHWKAGDGDVAVSIAAGDTYGAVSFESSDEAVLTVDAETGEITAVAMGTATVTATWAGGIIDAVRYCTASSSVEVAVSGTVTVSFDGNGATSGSMDNQVIYYNEATALSANAFSKDGYTFYGWAETDEKADAGERDYEGGESVTFTTDKTLYAVWQTNVRNLTLTQPTISEVAAGTITANGSTTSPASIAYGVEVTLAASENSSALDGYVFENWSVSGISLADATANPAVFTMPDNDVSVAAVYHHYTWDLTGYIVETAPATVYSNGDHFSKASVAIQAGYERSDDSSTKQVTLEAAEWTAKLDGTEIADDYTFVLADNGKTLTLWVDETQVGEDYVLTVNAIPTDQFVIGIWTSEVSPIADKTSAYSMPSIANQTAGEAATCKDHNLFVGWVEAAYKDEPEGHVIATGTAMTPANKTFYAVWAKTGTVTESISYGWETGDDASNWIMSAKNAGLDATTGSARSGTYGGSMTSTGTYVKTLSRYATPKGITYYIRKQSGNTNTNNYFVLRYSSDNSNWTEIASTKYTFNNLSNTTWTEVTCDLSAETYQNKYFEIRMISGASGSLDDIEFSYTTSGAVDYITDCIQRYQVTFDANGGTGSYDAIEKKEGATVTLPDGSALSRAAEHYHFNGWKVYNASTEAEISVSENQFTMPGADVNAVAQWEEDPKGTVYYVGDEITNSSITRYAGQTFDLRTEVTLPAYRKLVGWMLDGDETLYAPGRTMTMPDPVQDYTYHVQIINQLPKPSGVSFTDGEWVLVTNTDQLHEGDFVVIVGNETTNAMGTQRNTNRGVASVTKHNEGQTITITEDVAPLFLQYGYKEGEYALYEMVESGYLYASSNTSNDLKTSATYSNRNYSWKITIGEGNIASIVAQGGNSHNDLKYNPNVGSPLFSCYTGGQTAVQLYRYDGIRTVTITEEVKTSDIHITNADVIIANTGTLEVDATMPLRDVTIQSTSGAFEEAGTSGQLNGSGTLNIYGNLYLEIRLRNGEMDAEASRKWYCIAAPFDVDINGGFFWGDGTPMVLNTHFQLFEFDGDRRASGASAWKRISGTMKAGIAYFIGFDDERENQNTIKLKANDKTISNTDNIVAPAHSGSADAETYGNWNGLANPNFHHIALDQDVQAFDYDKQGYSPYATGEYNFVVGTPFFKQYEGNIAIEDLNDGKPYRAPKREGETYSYCVRIGSAEASRADNQIYVRASETASAEFDNERDMITLNNTSSANGALLWTENYGGKRLAIEEAPLVNMKATYAMKLSAPADGQYQISVAAPKENADLYLTYNGRIIWNLTASAYTLELPQGTTEGYGLVLKAKAPSVATSVDNVQSDNAPCTKVLIDEHVFIIRGGKMYDVTGKMVK